ncbi:MAG: MBL fold metallo-hydrolase [Oscillospiraceae bacterium]|nr:MBL fold metallo-hydrolase [Oscillospiraceae bacterium]
MIIKWHGHSCFEIVAEGCTVLFDPYADGSVPGLAPLHLTGDAVFCSHGHRDHNGEETVALSGDAMPLEVETIETFHDDKNGSLRGNNTIHILHGEGMRVAHMGDIGCPLTPVQAEKLKNVDALLIPVGGYYTIDAAQAAEITAQIAPRVVLPMHYRLGAMGYDVIGTLDAFTSITPVTPVMRYAENLLELTPETPAQTAILTYAGR